MPVYLYRNKNKTKASSLFYFIVTQYKTQQLKQEMRATILQEIVRDQLSVL